MILYSQITQPFDLGGRQLGLENDNGFLKCGNFKCSLHFRCSMKKCNRGLGIWKAYTAIPNTFLALPVNTEQQFAFTKEQVKLVYMKLSSLTIYHASTRNTNLTLRG